MGRFSTVCVVRRTIARRLRRIVGDSAVTSTVSDVPPTSSVNTGTATRSPGLTVTPARLRFLKPLIVASSEYESAVTLGNTKSPVMLVTTGADEVPRDSLTRTRVTPGTTPPWTSLTVPYTVPVVTCAAAEKAVDEMSMTTSVMRRMIVVTAIVLPPEALCELSLYGCVSGRSVGPRRASQTRRHVDRTTGKVRTQLSSPEIWVCPVPTRYVPPLAGDVWLPQALPFQRPENRPVPNLTPNARRSVRRGSAPL